METTYVLTAEMDALSFAWLDALRREYFPEERNFLSAHLTLFHKLSSAQIACVRSFVTPSVPITIRFDRVAFLGNCVAIGVRCAALERLRNEARSAIEGELSQQDRQPWKPHVTIQNKVSAETGRQLYRILEANFTERAGAATGLLVWEYLGGPWRLSERIAFGKVV